MCVQKSQLHLSAFIIYNIRRGQLAVTSYPRLLLSMEKHAEECTLKWWSDFTKPALLNPTMFYRQEFYTQAPTEPNPGPQGRFFFFLTSLFRTDILSSVFKCFPKKLLSSWPKQRPSPLACHREKSDAVLWATERKALYWDSSRCSCDSCRVVASPTL